METQTLIPISSKEFREIVKGCGIKYRNKIPSKELKAMFGYCPIKRGRKVEISDETGFCQVFETTKEAAKICGISNPSAIKYALDHDRSYIKRRTDGKKFYVKKI